MTVASLRAVDAQSERQEAMRALLAQPYVDAGHPAHVLVRRHEPELARLAGDLFGYRLEIGATAARLSGPPTAAGLRRPVRVRPASATGARRPVDEWPALSDRAAVLLFLTLAALERGGPQVAIADLAQRVADAGADAEPAIRVDFDERAERVAFADGLDLLVAWGVLEHTAGSHASYARRDQDADEALLTVDRRRLALVLRDPAGAAQSATLDDLLDESHLYADSDEGERRARLHRLARRLVEDPALLVEALSDEDRAYLHGQRSRIESAVAGATGLQVERRREGSALIVEGRELTDVPFPTNGMLKQLALLLCDELSRLGPGAGVSRADVRATVAALLREHREHWQRDPGDAGAVHAVATEAVALLASLGLVTVDDRDMVRPLPPCARYRAPDLRRGGAA